MRKVGIIVLLLAVVAVFGVAVFALENGRNEPEEKPEKVVITVLAGQSTSDAGVEDMIDEVIAEKFPGVELEWECVDWGEKFDSRMQGRLAAGDVPDIIVGKAQDIHAYMDGGNLAPLQVEGMERLEKGVRDTVTIDGEVYGIPYNAWYQGVVYSKEIFEQLQLKTPDTLEELAQTVQILEDNGVTPFAAHFRESWKVGNMTMQFLLNNVFAQEADWGEQFRLGNRDFAGDIRIRECVEQNKYVLEHSWEDALMIEQYESDRRFAEGQAAMYLTGLWSLQSMNQYDSNVRYGFFPYPTKEGGASLIKETNMTFMMSETSKYQELINHIFTELLQNEKLMQEILGFTGTYPVVTDMMVTYESAVEEDIRSYEAENRIIDASIGNNQLIWRFQNDLSEEILKWLKGEADLDEVLTYADEHRQESGNIPIISK